MAQFNPVLCHCGIENEKNGTFRVRFVTFWVITEVSRLGGEPARNEHNEPPRTRNGHFLVRNERNRAFQTKNGCFLVRNGCLELENGTFWPDFVPDWVLGTGEWHNLTQFCARLGVWNGRMAHFGPILCQLCKRRYIFATNITGCSGRALEYEKVLPRKGKVFQMKCLTRPNG